MKVVNYKGQENIVVYTVGTGGVTAGVLCALSSNTAVIAGGNAADDTIIGIAMETAAAAATAKIMEVTGDSVIEAPYTGSSKTSVTAADISKIYDVASGGLEIDLDDTTTGIFVCTGYNNDNGVIYGRIEKAARIN